MLSQNASMGWNPKVFLNVGAACSFSLWQTTTDASRSITSPDSSRPAACAGGNGRPARSARCAHATSRAPARADAIALNPAVSSRSSSRQHVESDATAPNNAA